MILPPLLLPAVEASTAPRSLPALIGDKSDNTLVVWGTVRNVKPHASYILSQLDYSTGEVLRGKVAPGRGAGPSSLFVREPIGAARSRGELAEGDEVVLFLRETPAGSSALPVPSYDIVAGSSGLFRVDVSRCATAPAELKKCPRTIVNGVNNQELFRGDRVWQMFLLPAIGNPNEEAAEQLFRTKVKALTQRFSSAELTRALESASRRPEGGVSLDLLRVVLHLYFTPPPLSPLR